MSVHGWQWELRGEEFKTLGQSGQGAFPAILAHLIRQRGLADVAALDAFLQPKLKHLSDPLLLPEMALAVARLLHAVDQGERVCVFGDYDVDGVSSLVVMHQILSAYGCVPRLFLPRRSQEGYGLSRAALARCLQEGEKPDLLIAVDCGTGSLAEIAELHAAGIDVVVIDHHELSPQGRPPVVALVNPKNGAEVTASFYHLCAAGVCFKVAHAMLKTRPLDHFDLKELLELVSVATVADIVPLVGENRLIVRHGLSRLPETQSVGLRVLQKKVGMADRATAQDVGFRIGPRLNAAGRMDAPEEALAMLLTQDEEEAEVLADALEAYNRERQGMEELIRREALAMLESLPDAPVIVLGSRDWHPGVVGIVAARLMRQFYKPTFVIAIDEQGVGKGSGRSIRGVSLVAAIAAGRDLLLAGGGHEMAAGISIRAEQIDAFRERFADHVLQTTSVEQRRARLSLDAELQFEQLSLTFLESYELLHPFGNGNPQPIFWARDVYPSRPPLHLKNQHMRLFLRQGHQGFAEQGAMFFSGAEFVLPDPPWDVAFTIDRNTFRGVTSLQMVIQDIRAAEPAAREVAHD